VAADPDANGNVSPMARLRRFENNRYVGDRAHQLVYDLEVADSQQVEMLEAAALENRLTVFGPDSLAEARNRGYRVAPT
jgi:hypothetical protein